MTAHALPRSQPATRATAVAAWCVAAAIASPFCFNAIQETDIGWHIALGREIVTHHAIPRTNLLSWTEPQYPYYPTSWLFDVVAHEAVTALGPAGLQLLTCLLLLLTLAGVTVACARLHPLGPWLVPATALLLIPRVTPRPHMVSWVIEAWVVAFAMLGRERGWRWRLGCVPLIVLGSNSHSGAIFAAGALGLFCLEAAWREGNWKREALICVATGLALIANPGGLYNVDYVFGNLSVFQQLPVDEMKPPKVSDLPAFFVMIPLAVLAGLVQVRRRPVMLGLALVFAALGLFAVRLAFEFYIVAMPVLAGSIGTLQRRSGDRAVKLAFALFITLSAACMIQRVWQLSPRLDWDERVLPVRATRYIAEQHLSGHGFNSFEDGGYFEYAQPHVPAFQDGRIQAYDPAFFDREIAAYEDPPTFQRYLRRLGVEWALTTSSQHGLSGNGMVDGPDWALIYWDDVDELYLRRDVSRFHDLVERDEFHYFLPSSSPDSIVKLAGTLGSAESQRLATEAERFALNKSGDAAAAIARCAAFARLQTADLAQVCGLAATKNTAEDWQSLVREARTLAAAK